MAFADRISSAICEPIASSTDLPRGSRLLVASVVLSFLVMFDAGCTPRSKSTPPAISVSPAHLELPSGRLGTKVLGEFIIANGGDRALEFSIQASCGCLGVEPNRGIILPRERRSIQPSILLDQLEKTVLITIRSSDPNHELSQLQVLAKATLPIYVSERSLDFGTICSSTISTKTRTIRLHVDDRASLANNVVVTPSCDWLQVSPSDATWSAWTVRVLPNALGLGDHRGHISVARKGFDTVTSIPVAIHVAPVIDIAPATVRFDRSSRPAARTLLVRRNDGVELGTLVRSCLPPYIDLQERSHHERHQHIRIYTAVLSDSVTDDLNESINLEFEGSVESVPINIVVRQQPRSHSRHFKENRHA